ncbi:MAG: hypothetical protein ABIY39_06470 [Sphingomonas sp.]
MHQITIIAALIAAAFSIGYLFENRGAVFRAIAAGHHVEQFAPFGLVLGLRW